MALHGFYMAGPLVISTREPLITQTAGLPPGPPLARQACKRVSGTATSEQARVHPDTPVERSLTRTEDEAKSCLGGVMHHLFPVCVVSASSTLCFNRRFT